jgi:hypothetical protein
VGVTSCDFTSAFATDIPALWIAIDHEPDYAPFAVALKLNRK